MDKTIAILMTGLILLTGYTVGDDVMSESEFEAAITNSFICDLTGEYGVFLQVSGNGYSGYPYAENRTKAERCGTSDNNGVWTPFNDYAEAIGVDPFTLYIQKITVETKQTEQELNPIVSGGTPQAQYICTPQNCTRVI